MQPLPIHKKWVFHFAIIILALSLVTPALADYLGPSRTVTQTTGVCKIVLNECQYVPSKDDYRFKNVDDWSCSNESKPWQAYPNQPPRDCFANTVGDQYWSREEDSQTVTITHPPATIGGSLQGCTLQNGWCGTTTPQLSLSATEPIAGHTIILIEGTLNGQVFACPGGAATCGVPLNQGDNNFAYWALSSWGDSSTMGSLTAKVDTVSPDLSLEITGAGGTNGWYVSPTTVTATGSDATSGLASALLSVNSGEWQASTTLDDGVYDIAVAASDNAGNASNASTTISIDTITPSINMSVSGTTGTDGWYRSGIQVSALSNDVTSGISSFEVSIGGGTYQSYTSPVPFSNGSHTIQFRATDNAGNVSETPLQEFFVDTIAPSVDLPAIWQLGKNVPYTVRDAGSGLASLRLVIEDEDERYAKVAWDEDVQGAIYAQDINWSGQFKDGAIAPDGTYLVWIKVSDKAGNEHIQLGKVIVPESETFFTLLEPEDASAEIAAPPEQLAPPEELFETEDISPGTVPPALDFGGTATEKNDTTTQSFSLTTGTAGTIPSASSDILWGTAAAAAISAATAYALAEQRKREEEEAAQAQRVAEELEHDAKKRAEKLQRQQDNWEAQQALAALAEPDETRQPFSIPIARKVAREEWEEGDAWRKSQEAPRPAFSIPIARKVAQEEWEEGADWRRVQEEHKQNQQITHLHDDLSNYWQGEKEIPRPEPNWWEKTKSWVNEKIVEPVNTHIYGPIVKPLIEWDRELTARRNEWVDKNIYQPFIKPDLDQLKQAADTFGKWWNEEVYQPVLKPLGEKTTEMLQSAGSWWNEEVYQPHLKPAIDKKKQQIMDDVEWLTQKVYQPFVQPALTAINERIYEPFVQPVVKKISNAVAEVITWADENIYEPVFAPVVNDINKYIYQPLTRWWGQYGEWVHGALDAVGFIPGLGEIADGVNGLIYLAEGRYLEAALSVVSMIPVVGDLGKVGKWTVKAGQEIVDTVVGKVAKQFFQESLEKVAKGSLEEGAEKIVKASGEWVHTALDLVGCIPDASNYTTTLNSLLYLSKGRILDATVTASTMIPVIGDFVPLGRAVIESSVNRVAKQFADEMSEKAARASIETTSQVMTKEAKEEILEQAAKEGGEGLVTKSIKESSQETIEIATRELSEEATEKVVRNSGGELVETTTREAFKEAGGEFAEKTTKEVFQEAVEKTANKARKELREDAVIERVTEEDANTKTTKAETGSDVEPTIEHTPDRVDEAESLNALREKYGDQGLDIVRKYEDRGVALLEQYGNETADFVSRAEKLGVDPTNILDRPPSPGQTLEGWLLGIESPDNPVNDPLADLNLTKAELNNILEDGTVRPESKVVVLGYGSGVDKPYYKLSDEIGGCHLSLSKEAWKPFGEAQANFWKDINSPFLEKGIENRKIFLFNIEYDVITNPRNVERFSLPELRLVEMEKNNYVQVDLGKYTAFVPQESLDTFEKDLPPGIFESGEQP